MSEVQKASRGTQLRAMLRTMVPGMVIDALLPYLIYTFLSPHTSQLNALIASSVPPVLSNIVSLIRARKLDAIGMIVFLGIIVSIIAIFLGGDPRILLVRESLVTGVLGVACLVSLVFPKPLMFYISLHFVSKNVNFYSLWQYAAFRRYMNTVTITWGIFFIVEFLFKIYLVYTFPISVTVGLAPVVFYVFLILMIVWTMYYSRGVRRDNQQPVPALAAQEAQEAEKA
jgi:hypothetical protein